MQGDDKNSKHSVLKAFIRSSLVDGGGDTGDHINWYLVVVRYPLKPTWYQVPGIHFAIFTTWYLITTFGPSYYAPP